MPIKINELHPWNLSYHEAVEVQKTLRPRLTLKPLEKPVRFVGGADVSYSKKSARLFAAVVIIGVETMETIETAIENREEDFPYFPGLLSFREIPVLLKAVRNLYHVPDVFLVDGQGIAHPQGVGLASHFGLCIDLPTVGCAKSRLIGEYTPFPKRQGDYAFLYVKGERVGAVVCTKEGVNPVFVSPGNRMDISSSITVTLKSCKGYRLPEPIRRAHALATHLREND